MHIDTLWDFADWHQRTKGTPEQYLKEKEDTVYAERTRFVLLHEHSKNKSWVLEVLRGAHDEEVFADQDALAVVRLDGR